MRDFRDSKAMASSLRDALATRSVSISHSESLELVAKILGVRDWNELSAQIRSGQDRTAPDTYVCLADRVDAPVLAVRDFVPFPGVIAPLFVVRERSKQAIERALAADKHMFVVAQRSPDTDTPELAELHRVGTWVKMLDLSDLHPLHSKGEALKVLVKGLERAALVGSGAIAEITAQIAPVEPSRDDGRQGADLREELLARIRAQSPARLEQVVIGILAATPRPGLFADLLAAHLRLPVAQAQDLLETADVVLRLEKLRTNIAASN